MVVKRKELLEDQRRARAYWREGRISVLVPHWSTGVTHEQHQLAKSDLLPEVDIAPAAVSAEHSVEESRAAKRRRVEPQCLGQPLGDPAEAIVAATIEEEVEDALKNFIRKVPPSDSGPTDGMAEVQENGEDDAKMEPSEGQGRRPDIGPAAARTGRGRGWRRSKDCPLNTIALRRLAADSKVAQYGTKAVIVLLARGNLGYHHRGGLWQGCRCPCLRCTRSRRPRTLPHN